MANKGPLSEDLVRLIIENIESVPHMETLQLLYENQARQWSVEDIGERIYQPTDKVRAIIRDLQLRGLIAESDEADMYVVPLGGNAADVVNRLVTAYRSNVYQVATLIHERGSKALREFARAFDLRRKKP